MLEKKWKNKYNVYRFVVFWSSELLTKKVLLNWHENVSFAQTTEYAYAYSDYFQFVIYILCKNRNKNYMQ